MVMMINDDDCDDCDDDGDDAFMWLGLFQNTFYYKYHAISYDEAEQLPW